MARKQQMERKTAVAIASGIMMTVVAAAVAIGINISIASAQQPTSGPGTYTPVALPAAASQQQGTNQTATYGAPTLEHPGEGQAPHIERRNDGDDD